MKMHALWDYLREPTLVWRSTWSVVGAFVLIWVVLLTYIYVENQRLLATDSGLQKFGDALGVALADVDDAERAATVVAATERWTTIRRAQDPRFHGVLLYELLDRDGRRVWASTGLAAGEIKDAPSLARVELNGEIHRVYQGANGRWTLRIAEPWRTASAFLSYNAKFLLPYLLIAAPCVLLPVWLSVRNGMKPLKQLASRIAARSPDDLNAIGYVARHRELKPLVHSLDALLQQLRHKVERERAFVQDAAHEMRTPLAVIAAQAHVLAHAPDAGQRLQAQEHLNSAIARASHLGRQLLDLAALDDAQRAAPRLIDLAQWVRQALAQVAPAAIARGIDITLEAPDTLQRSVDVPALESIVHNLVDNALRYGRDGGAVRVVLAADDAGWSLSVRDDGPGVAVEDRPRLFERFYRGAGHDAPGSGLGLAIVRQAARIGGGSVAITHGLDGCGIGFAVRMPEPVS